MKNTILVLAVMLFGAVGFAQIKVVGPNGDTKIGSTAVSPLSKLSITEDLSSLHIGESSSGLSNSSNIVDITTGLTGSMRIGSFDLTSNSVGGASIQFFNDNSAVQKGQAIIQSGVDNSAGVFLRTGSTTRLAVTRQGDVGIGTLSPAEKLDVNGIIQCVSLIETSDKRLKKGIENFDEGLDIVLNMQPKTYTFNNKSVADSDDIHIGVLAQDLQSIAPYLVKNFEHKTIEEATLDKGFVEKSSDNYLAIKSSEIKYILVNAIKEQQEIINDQNQRIQDLEEKMETLLNSMNNGTINNSEIITITSAELGQNYPNPLENETIINYKIPNNSSSSELNIYDLNGRLIKNINTLKKGSGQVILNLPDMPAGTYSYQLIVDDIIIDTKKMVITK